MIILFTRPPLPLLQACTIPHPVFLVHFQYLTLILHGCKSQDLWIKFFFAGLLECCNLSLDCLFAIAVVPIVVILPSFLTTSCCHSYLQDVVGDFSQLYILLLSLLIAISFPYLFCLHFCFPSWFSSCFLLKGLVLSLALPFPLSNRQDCTYLLRLWAKSQTSLICSSIGYGLSHLAAYFSAIL